MCTRGTPVRESSSGRRRRGQKRELKRVQEGETLTEEESRGETRRVWVTQPLAPTPASIPFLLSRLYLITFRGTVHLRIQDLQTGRLGLAGKPCPELRLNRSAEQGRRMGAWTVLDVDLPDSLMWEKTLLPLCASNCLMQPK